MDFDIKKVIGPLDTSDAVVGNKYCFSDTLDGVQRKVYDIGLLDVINDNTDYPFIWGGNAYRYVYPYEEPEKKYVPFTMDDAESIIGKVVKNKHNDFMMMITNCCTDDKDNIIVNAHQGKDLLENYTFLDGMPCGKEIEE